MPKDIQESKEQESQKPQPANEVKGTCGCGCIPPIKAK